MAGKFRRKFVDIISDTVTNHYQGKVQEESLLEILEKIREQIGKLEQYRQKDQFQRMENIKKLKKLPLSKLKELLVAQS